MKLWVRILAWGALLLTPPAHAQSNDEMVRVAWHWRAEPSAAECLRPDILQQRVEAQLGRPVFVAEDDASDVTLNLGAHSEKSALHVELELQREGESLGSRSLEGTSERCAKLIDSLVVVIALLVDVPRSNVEPARPTKTAPPEAPRAVRAIAPRAGTTSPSALRSAPRASNHLALNARALVSSGLLPDVALGFGLDVRASLGFATTLAWRLGGDYLPSGRVSAQGGQLSLSALSWQLGLSPWEFASGSAFRVRPWALASVALIAARGEGFAENRSGHRWLPALSVSASAEWQLARRLWLSAEPGLGIALERPTFVYDDPVAGQQTLFRPDFLLLSASLGLTWQFF